MTGKVALAVVAGRLTPGNRTRHRRVSTRAVSAFFLDTPGLLCYSIHMIPSTQLRSTIDAIDVLLEALP
jgi:hypothetical protein